MEKYLIGFLVGVLVILVTDKYREKKVGKSMLVEKYIDLKTQMIKVEQDLQYGRVDNQEAEDKLDCLENEIRLVRGQMSDWENYRADEADSHGYWDKI